MNPEQADRSSSLTPITYICRRCLEDLIGTTQFLHLTLEVCQPHPLISRKTRPITGIGLSPTNPDPQRLMIDVQLLRDRLDRFPL